jgi:exonuclease III
MSSKSIVAWNIRHGGGGGERSQGVVAALSSLDADVIVLTEFRSNSTGSLIKAALGRLGYSISHPDVPEHANSVLVASRDKMLASHPLDPSLADQRHLWVVELAWLRLCGVYMPLDLAKIPYWEALHRAAADASGPDLFIGDFNTGNNVIDLVSGASPFVASERFDEFGKGRLRDVWRTRNPETREYTWYSERANNGFRLDHAFAIAPVFERITRCQYLHRLREQGFSDHSALQVEMTIVTPPEVSGATPELRATIYAINDPVRPDLLKIGKDARWPQRLRQAQSHSPRELTVIGTWRVDRNQASAIERQVLTAFQRANDTDGFEWVKCGPDPADRISRVLSQPPHPQIRANIQPYDDWRDYVRPSRSDLQRRLWIGQERKTGQIKIVHSPHVDKFHRTCPTFSCLGFRWVAAWQFPPETWKRSATLDPTDAKIVSTWSRIVIRDGFGEDSPRVGWLREGVRLDALSQELLRGGLVPFDARKSGTSKTFVNFDLAR